MEIDIGVGFLIDNCYTEFADDFLSSEERWRRREMSDDEIMKLGILFSCPKRAILNRKNSGLRLEICSISFLTFSGLQRRKEEGTSMAHSISWA